MVLRPSAGPEKETTMREEGTWRRRGPEEGWRGGDDDFMWRRCARRHSRPVREGFPGGPPGPHMFGMWFGEPGRRGMRGPRARRGDVRAAALALLAEEPMNGYQIIQAIAERSDGVWRPSPGSVYPALQQLEDEGLVRAEAAEGGRRAYQLTEEGRSYVEAHPEEVRAPWDVVAGAVGDTAIEVLTDTRKALYRLLAADEGDASADTGQ